MSGLGDRARNFGLKDLVLEIAVLVILIIGVILIVSRKPDNPGSWSEHAPAPKRTKSTVVPFDRKTVKPVVDNSRKE